MAYQKLTPIIATGATAPRYLGDRCADIVNVKDFGAVGDGATDDTAAFTAAAAVSDYVFVPGGGYSLSEDVSGGFFALDDVTISGSGGAVNGETKLYSLARLTTPVGSVFWFTGSTAPSGSLLCNGAAVSRITYADLFAVIGTTYGAGDESTTFNLPNLIDKFIEGGSTNIGNSTAAGLPNIEGMMYPRTGNGDRVAGAISGADGCFQFYTQGSDTAASTIQYLTGSKQRDKIVFNASISSSIYGNSSTVQPPALTLLPCIKY